MYNTNLISPSNAKTGIVSTWTFKLSSIRLSYFEHNFFFLSKTDPYFGLLQPTYILFINMEKMANIKPLPLSFNWAPLSL